MIIFKFSEVKFLGLGANEYHQVHRLDKRALLGTHKTTFPSMLRKRSSVFVHFLVCHMTRRLHYGGS